ncbi:hypothetical protein [Paraflavitalea speifideaquila]|uniref:hypothetical protein n=1 Tax=Paraflavitalea speifideaquila TaxID=3076558 RepID=UPI0028F0A302|nr:hypothetical protein [Paraflavitalea speifideiaquila]
MMKVTCKTDRRLVDVTITEKGLSLLNELDGCNDDMDASVGSLTEDEALTLNGLLDKMRG